MEVESAVVRRGGGGGSREVITPQVGRIIVMTFLLFADLPSERERESKMVAVPWENDNDDDDKGKGDGKINGCHLARSATCACGWHRSKNGRKVGTAWRQTHDEQHGEMGLTTSGGNFLVITLCCF